MRDNYVNCTHWWNLVKIPMWSWILSKQLGKYRWHNRGYNYLLAKILHRCPLDKVRLQCRTKAMPPTWKIVIHIETLISILILIIWTSVMIFWPKSLENQLKNNKPQQRHLKPPATKAPAYSSNYYNFYWQWNCK